MTRRGGKESLGEKKWDMEGERQLVMAQLVARWRRSNLVILVTLKKGNHLGEAYVRRGRRKALYITDRDSLEGPHEEAEIQRKALKQEKSLAFSEDTCLEKERVRSQVTPRKVGVGLKRRRELSKRRLGWRLAWWESTEKKEASYFLGLRGRHSTPTSAPIETELLVWPPPKYGPRRKRTKWPGCQQPPQRGSAVPDLVWVESKWLLVFPRVPVIPDTPPIVLFGLRIGISVNAFSNFCPNCRIELLYTFSDFPKIFCSVN